LIDAWPTLPLEIRATIKTILAAANPWRIVPSFEQQFSAECTIKSTRRPGDGGK
jgi:hypothetical protein